MVALRSPVQQITAEKIAVLNLRKGLDPLGELIPRLFLYSAKKVSDVNNQFLLSKRVKIKQARGKIRADTQLKFQPET